MIALVEGAERQKTPNELALSILLSGLTLIFLIVCVTLWPLAAYSGTVLSVTVLIALLVCLIPTTIGGLLSAIGIAGMDRLIRFNVIATSGRAVEAAGDVDTLLLDKTGTITFGNRMADEFIAVAGRRRSARWPKRCCSPASPTRRPEGRSIVALAKSRYGVAAPAHVGALADRAVHRAHAHVRHRSAADASLRKGAVDAILAAVRPDARQRAGRFQSGGRSHLRAPAARRWPSPTTSACSASSISRTSSSPTSGRASPSCARWASRR